MENGDMEKNSAPSGILKKMSEIQSEIAKEGLKKSHRNEMQKYSFRSIDDIYNLLGPKLGEKKVCVIPQVLSKETEMIKDSRDKTCFRSIVVMQYSFIDVEDSSSYAIQMVGEGIDFSDKSMSKAASMAYKYALFQAFCIPLESEKDPDFETTRIDNGNDPANYRDVLQDAEKRMGEFTNYDDFKEWYTKMYPLWQSNVPNSVLKMIGEMKDQFKNNLTKQ